MLIENNGSKIVQPFEKADFEYVLNFKAAIKGASSLFSVVSEARDWPLFLKELADFRQDGQKLVYSICRDISTANKWEQNPSETRAFIEALKSLTLGQQRDIFKNYKEFLPRLAGFLEHSIKEQEDALLYALDGHESYRERYHPTFEM